LAGGESRRFGGEKALFPLGGRPMAAWALAALRPWTKDQLLVTNDEAVAEALHIQTSPDLIPGQGPLGGLHTALSWVRDRGMDGAFVLACDLPLITKELVGRVLELWPEDAPAVVPGSQGPLGLEPLCGAYGVQCLPALEQLLREGDRSLEAVIKRISAHRIPSAALGTREELARAFTNVNTMATAKVADAALRPTRAEGGDA
jgi:molybdopterin-guanine dinucleotide biosynthesis protein A